MGSDGVSKIKVKKQENTGEQTKAIVWKKCRYLVMIKCCFFS
jgi:hypothetical protein